MPYPGSMSLLSCDANNWLPGMPTSRVMIFSGQRRGHTRPIIRPCDLRTPRKVAGIVIPLVSQLTVSMISRRFAYDAALDRTRPVSSRLCSALRTCARDPPAS